MASLLLALLKLPLFFLLEIVYFVFRCRPKKDIKNQHILITGAGQGIGAEFARQFAEMGNTVHCVDIEEKLVKDVVEELKGKGHQAYAYTCDLTKHEQVQGLFDEIAGSGFVINVLVNNAGVGFGTSITKMSLTQIQHSLTVNIVANLWLIKLFLPKMLELNQGHVVNIASTAAFIPAYYMTDYCAAKAGSVHTMNQLRMQYSSSNVKFTAICPGVVRTKLITVNDDICARRLDAVAMEPRDLVSRAIVAVQEDREVLVAPTSDNVVKTLYGIAPFYVKHAFCEMVMHDLFNNITDDKYVGQNYVNLIK